MVTVFRVYYMRLPEEIQLNVFKSKGHKLHLPIRTS